MANSHTVVPWQQLSAEILQRVLEDFVLREGTDYGETEYSLEDKVAAVRLQLATGAAQISYDLDSDSVSVVVARP